MQSQSSASAPYVPAPEAVWEFEVSGWKVVQQWVRYRLRTRAGRAASELDKARPVTWTFSTEFLQLLWLVETLTAAHADAAYLLEEVVASDLLTAADLPMPTAADREPPEPPPGAARKLPTRFPHLLPK